MQKNDTEHVYRTKKLERQVVGMQRQIGVMNARLNLTEKKYDRRLRDVEIKLAVQQGVSQKKVAEIYELSAGRVNQIIKKVT